jgi:hypothetical protein
VGFDHEVGETALTVTLGGAVDRSTPSGPSTSAS